MKPKLSKAARTSAFLLLLSLVLIEGQVHIANTLHERGIQLSMLRNLPHRYLGLLYISHMMQPHRFDWEKDYIFEWAIATYEMRVLEGTTRPVIPEQAILAAAFHPEDKEMQKIKGLCCYMARKDYERKQKEKD